AFTVQMISPFSLSLMTFGGLWFCLWQKSWRFLAILPLILGIYFAYKTPLPNLLIDGEQRFFALYNKEIGLVFSEIIRSENIKNIWMKKMGENEVKTIGNLSEKEAEKLALFCQKPFCQLQISGHKILIHKARNKEDFICQKQANIVVNLTKKYQ